MLHVALAPDLMSLDATPLAQSVVPFFQPIYAAREGRVEGFEALARLRSGSDLLMPAQFLQFLDEDASARLFGAMLTKSLAFLEGLGAAASGLFVSVNVNASTLLLPDFVDMVRFAVDAGGISPARLVVEILEGEAIASTAVMSRAIERLRALGVGVALDDVGSAYASLMNIKDLPVDILKLDRSFTLGLARKPEDLQFISSMLGLARGLDRRLVVEGAETADSLDALTIIGVEHVQGYAIARPMPAAAVPGWMAAADLPCAGRDPHSMLGVYAAHLTIVEACRVLSRRALRVRIHEEAADPHRCRIGAFLDRHGLHGTACGLAHKRFHAALADEGDSRSWVLAAEELRLALLEAVAEDPIRSKTGL